MQIQDNSGSATSSSRRSWVTAQKKVQELRRQHSETHADALVVALPEEKPTFSASGRRNLLQAAGTAGITVIVSVSSLTAEDQNIMASGINATLLESYSYQTVVPPYAVMSDVENSNDPVGTIAGGFQVVGVQYNDTDSR